MNHYKFNAENYVYSKIILTTEYVADMVKYCTYLQQLV